MCNLIQVYHTKREAKTVQNVFRVDADGTKKIRHGTGFRHLNANEAKICKCAHKELAKR